LLDREESIESNVNILVFRPYLQKVLLSLDEGLLLARRYRFRHFADSCPVDTAFHEHSMETNQILLHRIVELSSRFASVVEK
jgi:hypothetical protein